MTQQSIKSTVVCILLLLLCACTVAPAHRPAETASPSVTPAGVPAGIGQAERWIEVDLARQMVRLHDGDQVIAEYLAAAGVGDGPETTTYTGLLRVQSKTKGPIESAPGVYVSDVVVFDMFHGNGFHSMPMDEAGHVLDDRLGQPITAGCVRVGESAALFDFATLGMKVWIH